MRSPLAIAGLLVIGLSVAVVAGRSLSDAEKKEIAYQMYDDYKGDDFPDIPDISPDSAIALWQRGRVVFVDTRTGAERNVSALPGAVTEDQLRENIDQYANMTVVAYCTISYRSAQLVLDLSARGIDARNLRGGILAWTLEGHDVYHDGVAVRRIHVYGGEWNYAPKGYEAVEFGLFQRFLRWLF